MTYALATLVCVYLLWVHYVAVMRLMQVRDAGHLTTAMKAIGYPALVVGLLLDLIVNTVVATLIFLELPKELTVSSRLTRHSERGEGWRMRVALAIRTALLDNIDPNGVHRG
jgi:hypothetical protein